MAKSGHYTRYGYVGGTMPHKKLKDEACFRRARIYFGGIMKKLIFLMAALLVPLTVTTSFAGQLRVFVADINITGVQNKDEMKAILRSLLASRLNNDRIIAVGSAAEAEAVVSGTYISIGNTFSIDAIATTVAGKTLNRSFVQGTTQDELIPAVGKLAEKLADQLVKVYPGTNPVAAGSTKMISNESQLQLPPVGGFVKSREIIASATDGWVSKRLDGAANLMAVGLIMPDGSREIFLAEGRRLAYYRQGRDMILVAETELSTEMKIISLDTIAGIDSNLEIYVTVIRSGELASQVWQVKDDKLHQVAEKLPYYFRSVTLPGAKKSLYAQSMGRDEDYYGDVAEATRVGSVVTLRNPLKMPRYGNIYNFNQFLDRDGRVLTVVINPDGYLIVYNQRQDELWRSNDKFGGSELNFQKEDIANMRVLGDKFRWIFLNQRIQVSSKGEVLVGKNDGFWVLGNARSYKRGAVYCMVWNGSSLEEKWRTRETQNYMPDYFLDDTRNELLILQTVKRPGFANRGASSLSIKKIE